MQMTLPMRWKAKMKHIISLLMENEAGALSRVAGLFSARAYNIESLTVAPTEDATLSRMTIVTSGSDEVIEQIIKQLNKLIDVVKVLDLNDGRYIERELMLVKVKAAGALREEMKRISDIFRGRIIDVADGSYTIELTGSGSKLDAFLEALDKTVILETVRTGACRHWSRRQNFKSLIISYHRSKKHRKAKTMKVYYDKDADLSIIKNLKVTIVGYGSQGHAHAQNLKDSGVNVTVGIRKAGISWAKAQAAGHNVAEIADAVKAADVVMLLLPDENMAQIYEAEVAPHLKKGAALAFAHGFNIHYNQVDAPPMTWT